MCIRDSPEGARRGLPYDHVQRQLNRLGSNRMPRPSFSGSGLQWRPLDLDSKYQQLQQWYDDGFAPWYTLMRDGVSVRAPYDQLVPGDVLLLGHGDVVPAMCTVLAQRYFADQTTHQVSEILQSWPWSVPACQDEYGVWDSSRHRLRRGQVIGPPMYPADLSAEGGDHPAFSEAEVDSLMEDHNLRKHAIVRVDKTAAQLNCQWDKRLPGWRVPDLTLSCESHQVAPEWQEGRKFGDFGSRRFLEADVVQLMLELGECGIVVDSPSTLSPLLREEGPIIVTPYGPKSWASLGAQMSEDGVRDELESERSLKQSQYFLVVPSDRYQEHFLRVESRHTIGISRQALTIVFGDAPGVLKVGVSQGEGRATIVLGLHNGVDCLFPGWRRPVFYQLMLGTYDDGSCLAALKGNTDVIQRILWYLSASTTPRDQMEYLLERSRKFYLETDPVSYTHLRAHETPEHLVCRLLLEKKKITKNTLYCTACM
eukprot:TRINITY_DN55518_c0_g1_i1.p1 TRINITY_DN55518_c0_g1~~TRINITY_DN55518_c0_g1_i1.p1  ORF type:complete len:482 (+),score=64.56 TRINITY_DN55518_c0_g1_i1:108-1553(+)